MLTPALEQLHSIDDYEDEKALLLLNLGIVYASIGDYEKAFDSFERGFIAAESEGIQQAIKQQQDEICKWLDKQVIQQI